MGQLQRRRPVLWAAVSIANVLAYEVKRPNRPSPDRE